jgi:hypothetical protein
MIPHWKKGTGPRVKNAQKTTLDVGGKPHTFPSKAEEVLDKLVGWFEPIRDHARNDEKHFDEQGTDYLYDRGKCAGVALFIEFEVRKKIQSLRTP